ncbi:MAG: quinone-interacting membrane-bound oxidoreductase complex subunit QmoC [Deltaproteobacteria bacterium]|nr:quinone-interacting membrane-bound oxidoreductase complex subunit QmoC [Deltaproteobacteria bacterium]
MARDLIAEPDLQFTKDLIAAGGDDLKKCYQCATCSVACKVAPDNYPFPRKEMIWAQWGQKDKLLNDPDVWLCHQCNDCSITCPRGANPGDALKAVRKMVIQNNARPGFFGKLVGESSMFVLALGIPAVIVLLILMISGFGVPAGPVKYSAHHLHPKDGFIWLPLIQVIFTAALAFSVVSLVMSLKTYWNNLETNNPVPVGNVRRDFVPSLLETLSEILPHTTFKECEANNIRYSAHLLTFWGMIGLAVTTAIVAFNVDMLGLLPPSQNGPGTVPIKILGNISAIAFVVGLGIMLFRRLNVPDQVGGSSYFDWFFLVIICAAGVTGVLTELSRFAGWAGGAYTIYAFHLWFVLTLLLYIPFSKFAHLGYRTVAIAWSKSAGRNVMTATKPKCVSAPPVEAAQP